jgi:hypothetical protein
VDSVDGCDNYVLKLSLQRAAEAHGVVRRRGSHMLFNLA